MTEADVIWNPTPKQREFLAASEDEVLYGGAAGGGKTDALIIDALGLWQQAPLVPRYRALLLRKSMAQLREVIDRSRMIYPQIVPGAQFSEQAKEFRFPSGAKVVYGYLERDADCDQYQGQEYQYIGFEELTQWASPYAYHYLRSRLRGTHLKKLLRATCNPGGAGSKWVQEYWSIPDSGAATSGQRTIKVDKAEVVIRSRFIPARVTDNPHLGVDYQAALMTLPEMQRRALLDGRWDVLDIPGQIYGKEISAAHTVTENCPQSRICSVPHDEAVPVHTAWDLGIGDATTIWCFQLVGREVHCIAYYEASGEPLTHYFGWLDDQKAKHGWPFADHIWPHDGKARELQSGKTREEVARTNGYIPRILPAQDVDDGINAARLLFPRIWFDAKGCKRGLECLTHYRREYNNALAEFKARPVHDWSSHGADAFRYLALGLRETRKKPEFTMKSAYSGSAQGWMG